MKFIRRALPYVVLVALVGATIFVWLDRERLQDSLILRGYTPAVEIQNLAADTAMTEYAKRLFLVNKPALNDKVALNTNCKDLAEEAAVLGCFKGDRQGIYIYDITDGRLYGIEQVTAAHEMLHQAYERLSPTERAHINALLEDYYRAGLADQSVKDKMLIYEKTEPNDLANEMHSIFGTELENLPTELEAYYTRYFTDRQRVVAFRKTSQAAFDTYRNQILSYDKRLEELKPSIEQLETVLTAEIAQLRSTKAEMDADLAAGRIQEYNAAVTPYNTLVKTYNQQLAALNKQIEEYNKIVAERNALSVKVSELNEALDSSLTPQ